MDSFERDQYWMDLEQELLKGGAGCSEWCTFISKDVYTAFTSGADLSTVVMSLACIETCLKTENFVTSKQSLSSLIEEDTFLTDEEKSSLHELRQYRNKWVHMYDVDDTEIIENEELFVQEAEKKAYLAVKMLLTVLYLNQYI